MQSEPTTSAEMPLYKCHKQVRALKIEEVTLHDPEGSNPPLEFAGGFIFPENKSYPPIPITAEFWHKHKPQPDGYFIQYADGHTSYSPAKAFEEGYTVVDPIAKQSCLTFGSAIEALKSGLRVCRAGWNGKGMWLSLSCDGSRDVAAENFWSPHNAQYARENGGTAKVLPSITMKTATGEILMGWLASQTDMLAEDWMIVPSCA